MRRSRTNRRGAATVAILVLLVVANLIVVGVVVGGARDQDLSVRRLETIRAFYAAEGGMNMALREISTGIDEDGDGTVGTISNDGNDANNPTLGAATLLVSSTAAAGKVTLSSDGTAGLARRRLQTLVEGSDGDAPGLKVWRYASVGSPNVMTDIDWYAAPASIGVVTQLNRPSEGASEAGWVAGPLDDWAQAFAGKITVDQGGLWTFYLDSDDGSQLWVDDVLVVDNDGVHTMTGASGSTTLTVGKHDVLVKWFDRTGSQGLIVSWSGPGVPVKTVIPSSALTH